MDTDGTTVPDVLDDEGWVTYSTQRITLPNGKRVRVTVQKQDGYTRTLLS